uniref:Uncharacterized protein n=1 Tax=uncultured prokaryote TaxID=198431 RepID=A0A0H5Q2L2_9ZZZZ|nr:hypothetical protein [uncultured prokaryote]
MMVEKSAGYAVTIARRIGEPGWVRISLRKHFWSVAQGSRSRQVAETGFYAEGMSERDILESALRELLLALNDSQG